MLFLSACKEHLKATSYYNGKKEPNSEPRILYSLAKVVVPDWIDISTLNKRTISDSTRAFKLCEGDGGSVYPFTDKPSMALFNQRIKTDYPSLLLQMSETISNYMDIDSRDKPTRLVHELITLLEADGSIDTAQPFYIQEDGFSVTKAQILKMQDICLHSFLLGIWHYALNRPEGNKVGADMIKLWSPSTNGGHRDYKGDLINRASRFPAVHLWSKTNAANAHSAESIYDNQSAPSGSDDAIESEIINDYSDNAERDESKTANQTVFINNGSGVQIGVNYGPINFSPRKAP